MSDNKDENTPEQQLRGVSTKDLVDEIVRRGYGTTYFIPPHAEYALRSYEQGVQTVYDAGTGPILFVAVID